MRLAASRISGPIRGEIDVPGDKSISHRSIIFSSLAEGTSTIRGFLRAEDTLATLQACRQLGVQISDNGDLVSVTGRGLRGLQQPPGVLDLGNSGTAMRLLSGVLAAQNFASELRGDQSLQSRPMARIVDPLKQMGANVAAGPGGCAPLFISPVAGLQPLEYTSPVASAQVKSCILLAGLCAGVAVRVTEPQKSRDHSERILAAMGAGVQVEGLSVFLPAKQSLSAIDMEVPGDPSSAAFVMVAASLCPGSNLVLRNTGMNPGRDGIIRVLQRMGAEIEITNSRESGGEQLADIRVTASGLEGIDLPEAWVPACIDEIPVIMIAAACANGVTRIRGAQELRVKESDRLAVMAEGLKRLGVKLDEYPDGVDIEGGSLNGGSVDAFDDHRCAMSFLIAGQFATAPVVVDGCEMIASSYPEFTAQMRSIGMQIENSD